MDFNLIPPRESWKRRHNIDVSNARMCTHDSITQEKLEFQAKYWPSVWHEAARLAIG